MSNLNFDKAVFDPSHLNSESQKTSLQLFEDGLIDAFKRPIKGVEQLAGIRVDLRTDAQEAASYAYAAGQMIGGAALFYACSAVLKIVPKIGSLAPIAVGGVLGFAEPVQNNSIKERIVNSGRGFATMAILDRMPGLLTGRVFRGDIIGNTANVFASGAIAGIIDVNMQSVLLDGKGAGLGRTLASAASWGAVGAAFHLSSLTLSKGFQELSEDRNRELLLISQKRSDASFRTRDFLNSVKPDGIKYHQINSDKPALRSLVNPEKSYVVFPDGGIVDGTKTVALAEKLNLHTRPNYDSYRVVVVGAGPAGVQSAVTLGSELQDGQKVAVVAERLGGQAGYTSSIKNYMGYSDVTGAELMTKGINGAKDRGAEFVIGRAQRMEHVDGGNILTLADGTKVKADAVVLATGMKYNQLDAPGIERLAGKGVYTLADTNEGPLTRGEHVAIVGAGNSAGQAAVNFSGYAKTVDMLVRGKSLDEKMSEYLVREVKARPNIKVHLQTEVRAVDGQNHLEAVTVKTKTLSGETIDKLNEDALYVYIGGKPNTQFLKGSGIKLDDHGYILTGDQLKETTLPQQTAPLPFETSIPGVFAAGDVNAANPWKRIVGAVSDGGRLMDSLEVYLPGIVPTKSLPLAPQVVQTNTGWSEHFSVPLPLLEAAILRSQPKISTNDLDVQKKPTV